MISDCDIQALQLCFSGCQFLVGNMTPGPVVIDRAYFDIKFTRLSCQNACSIAQLNKALRTLVELRGFLLGKG